MKHIFYVHSHITYIVARSVVLEENIPSQNIFFIFGRGYSVEDFPYPHVNLSDRLMTLTQTPTYGERFLIRKLGLLREIDRILARATQGEQFVVYLPSTKNYLMQFLITHSQCIGFNIIEEGLSLYAGINIKLTNPHYRNTVVGRIKVHLKYLDHLRRSTIYYEKKFSKPHSLYTISDNLQSFLPNELIHVLSEWYIPEIPQKYHLTNESVFFFDGMVEHQTLDINEFERVFELFVAYWITTGKRLWLKFHPANTKIQSIVYSILQRQCVDFVEIPPSICPEALLLNSHELSVFGFYSSLLYYAAKFGQKAYSLDGLIESAATRLFINSTVPADFFDKVARLRL